MEVGANGTTGPSAVLRADSTELRSGRGVVTNQPHLMTEGTARDPEDRGNPASSNSAVGVLITLGKWETEHFKLNAASLTPPPTSFRLPS